MTYATQVLIDGEDITAYLINYIVDYSYGDIVAGVEMYFTMNISSLVDLRSGVDILIYRGWTTSTDTCIFKGFVESVNPMAGKIKVTGKDMMWDLVRKEITHFYDADVDDEAGVMSAIFQDLVTTYGLLDADSTTVQNSGTANILDRFICNHADIFERCKALAKALDWQFYYKPWDDKVYFEPKGYRINTNVLTVGTNVYNVPDWQYDRTEMINDITITGAVSNVETTETGRIGTTTGYTTTGITLQHTPVSVKYYQDSANPPTTLKVGGIPDSTTTFFYYVDSVNNAILPKPGTTFTSTDYSIIDYTYAIPTPVHMSNQSSIDSYGKFQKTITLVDIRTVNDAQQRGQNLLASYSQPFISATLKVKPDEDLNLFVGQLINVVDQVNTSSVIEELTITRHRIRYPLDYEEVEVGDRVWRLAEWNAWVSEEIKRLKEKELENQEVLTELSIWQVDNPATPRYLKAETSPDGIVETLHTMQQYQNLYSEDFRDEDFNETTVTDAVWDTTERLLDFTQ